MIIRAYVRTVFASLVVMSLGGCAPQIKDLNLSQDIIDNMPREQALDYLRSLVPGLNPTENYCVFDNTGVLRGHGTQIQVAKYPYESLAVQTLPLGNVGLVEDRVGPWCRVDAAVNALHQRKDIDRVTGKIVMALMRMGVRAGDAGESGLRPKSSSGRKAGRGPSS